AQASYVQFSNERRSSMNTSLKCAASVFIVFVAGSLLQWCEPGIWSCVGPDLASYPDWKQDPNNEAANGAEITRKLDLLNQRHKDRAQIAREVIKGRYGLRDACSKLREFDMRKPKELSLEIKTIPAERWTLHYYGSVLIILIKDEPTKDFEHQRSLLARLT